MYVSVYQAQTDDVSCLLDGRDGVASELQLPKLQMLLLLLLLLSLLLLQPMLQSQLLFLL